MARRRSLARRLLRAIGLLTLCLAAASFLVVLLLRWVPVPFTSFMLQDRAQAWLSGAPPHPFHHDWVAWPEISPNVAVAVVAAEDQKFAWHLGFDLASIDRALADARRGKRLRGASTISQQVAKNLFLWPGQSWLRKGLEAWFTLLIEILWPKQRILEVYLNSAEFGLGIWGVEAASRRFFDKPAKRLDRPEAALLAAVLPNPKRLLVQAPSSYLRSRQAWILGQMAALGDSQYLDSFEAAEARPVR